MVEYRKLKQSLKQRVTADIQTQETKLNHKNTQFKHGRGGRRKQRADKTNRKQKDGEFKPNHIITLNVNGLNTPN